MILRHRYLLELIGDRGCEIMRSTALFVLLVSILSFADSSLTARRDAALKAVDACVQRNEVSSRECKKLNANVRTLVNVYKQGDKTVLPTLFKFTYLTDFYGDALLADPDGFITEMSRLPGKDQEAVVRWYRGGDFWTPHKRAIRGNQGAPERKFQIQTRSKQLHKSV